TRRDAHRGVVIGVAEFVTQEPVGADGHSHREVKAVVETIPWTVRVGADRAQVLGIAKQTTAETGGGLEALPEGARGEPGERGKGQAKSHSASVQRATRTILVAALRRAEIQRLTLNLMGDAGACGHVSAAHGILLQLAARLG